LFFDLAKKGLRLSAVISVASGMMVPLPLLYIITLVYNSIQNDQLAVKTGGEANLIISLHELKILL
jgi:hypothetical protein